MVDSEVHSPVFYPQILTANILLPQAHLVSFLEKILRFLTVHPYYYQQNEEQFEVV